MTLQSEKAAPVSGLVVMLFASILGWGAIIVGIVWL